MYTKLTFTKWSDYNDLVVEIHTMGAVNDELLPHTTEIILKDNSYRKINGVLKQNFSLQCKTGLH